VREYRERDADNARWNGFEFRPGDIVIDAPSKSGTTWTQLLVALLVFDGPAFPEPIGKMSLWMEQRTRPAEEAHATFAAQRHRRFIKSHTPLDGVPMVDEVRYVCVGRDPRDAAVSMLHHCDNMDRKRFAELIGGDPASEPPRPRPSVEEELDRWLSAGDFPDWTARFLAHHYRTFWELRHLPNVALFHFEDYLRDLPGELRRLAAHLGIDLSTERAAELADEATLGRARDRAVEVAPDVHLGLWKDPARFFRSGTSGEWSDVMTRAQQNRYEQLIAEVVPPDLARWMHHGRG
jgi:hypothetical protein